jgi:hypothetical protein
VTRNELLVLAALVGVGGAVVLLGRPRGATSQGADLSDPRIDPDIGRHRGLPVLRGRSSAEGVRLPSSQEPRIRDKRGYPYSGDSQPSLYATGYWKGYGSGPIGYSPIDYGPTPIRIPRLWHDGIRYWDGIAQRGYTQQNYRLFLFHLRPSAPTRGYRSISGVLANGGPTSSRRRIPAIFVPTAVS